MKIYITAALAIIGLLGFLVFRSSQSKSQEIHVLCKTTKGDLEIVMPMSWSPLGAQRFLQMVDDGHFTGLPLFRCLDKFLCQFGPSFRKHKMYAPMQDEPQEPSLRNFKKGYLSFAGSGPNSRATHIFVALSEAPSLGSQPWETPFGYITQATYDSTVAHFTTKYGEMAPMGKGPDPARIEAADGEAYLKANFPELDYFESCTRVP